MSIEAIKQVKMFLENLTTHSWTLADQKKAIELQSQAIADLESQEPVAAQCKFDTEKEWECCSIEHHNLVQSEPHKWRQYQTRLLYTHPQPKREWVGLTDEDIDETVKMYWGEMKGGPLVMNREYVRAIEAKLKEKNT